MARIIISIIISVLFPVLVFADDGSYAIGDFVRNSSRPTSEMSENIISVFYDCRDKIESIKIFAATDKGGNESYNRKLAAARTETLYRLVRQVIPKEMLPEEKISLHAMTYKSNGTDSTSSWVNVKFKSSEPVPASIAIMATQLDVGAMLKRVGEIDMRLDMIESRLIRSIQALLFEKQASRQIPITVREGRKSVPMDFLYSSLVTLASLQLIFFFAISRMLGRKKESIVEEIAKNRLDDIPNAPFLSYVDNNHISGIFLAGGHILQVICKRSGPDKAQTLSARDGTAIEVAESGWRDHVQLMLERLHNGTRKDQNGKDIDYRILIRQVEKGNIRRLKPEDLGQLTNFDIGEKR